MKRHFVMLLVVVLLSSCAAPAVPANPVAHEEAVGSELVPTPVVTAKDQLFSLVNTMCNNLGLLALAADSLNEFSDAMSQAQGTPTPNARLSDRPTSKDLLEKLAVACSPSSNDVQTLVDKAKAEGMSSDEVADITHRLQNYADAYNKLLAAYR